METEEIVTMTTTFVPTMATVDVAVYTSMYFGNTLFRNLKEVINVNGCTLSYREIQYVDESFILVNLKQCL